MAEFILAGEYLVNPHRIDFVKLRGSSQDRMVEIWFHGNPPTEGGLVLEGPAAEELLKALGQTQKFVAADEAGTTGLARPQE